jgi:hypothetical protein
MESSELRFETTTPIREFRRWFRGRPSYTREQLREFAKDAGRPVKVDARTQRRLKQLLAAGRSQAECAAELGVSPRTVGRAVARMQAGV